MKHCVYMLHHTTHVVKEGYIMYSIHNVIFQSQLLVLSGRLKGWSPLVSYIPTTSTYNPGNSSESYKSKEARCLWISRSVQQSLLALLDCWYKHNISIWLLPADPFVKLYLLHKGKRQRKWKTTVKKNTLVAVFNESFQLDLGKMNLKDISLDFVVMDYDRFKRDNKIGIITIGEQSAHESGRNHWADMLSSPGHTVSQWHSIMPFSP